MTGNSSVYLYTGIEGQYGIGPLKILPSFAPGYYEKGDGKDLGSVLEFKSEIKVGLELFENSKLSYSYSHMSNNEWGDTNPGTESATEARARQSARGRKRASEEKREEKREEEREENQRDRKSQRGLTWNQRTIICWKDGSSGLPPAYPPMSVVHIATPDMAAP